MSLNRILITLSLACLFGCNLVGPRTVRDARFNYNEAIATSAEEQYLLNLVRLRYGHAPFFLQVGSVTAQYEAEVNASYQRIIDFEATSDEESTVGGGLGFSERPTITYIPLQGEELAKVLLTPLSLDKLFLLIQAGWDPEVVFHACVSRIGPVANEPASAQEFHKVVESLKSLSGSADVYIAARPDSRIVEFQVGEDPQAQAGAENLRKLLGPEGSTEELKFVPYFSRKKDEIGVALRSPLAIMNVLAQGVDVPEKDMDIVVSSSPAHAASGSEIFRADHSRIRPGDAYVKVRYRGKWFSIDARDTRSKATFAMLSHLFSLQAGKGNLLAPLQTISVGQ